MRQRPRFGGAIVFAVIVEDAVTLELAEVIEETMGTNEHDAIQRIGEEVKATRELIAEHVADFRVFKTKLLGDDKDELPTGRIPLIEAEIKQLKRRQDRQSRLVWIASGFALCLNVIGWALNLFSHLSGVFKR